MGRTFSAWKPFGPLVTSNSTVWPSCRLRKPPAWMAEKCTNTSSPDWRLIKPKPLASLNHFTVPCSIVLPVSIVFEFLLRRIAAGDKGIAGWRNRPSTAGESNLADNHWMCQPRERFISMAGRQNEYAGRDVFLTILPQCHLTRL